MAREGRPRADLDQTQSVPRDQARPTLNRRVDNLARPSEPGQLDVVRRLRVVAPIEMAENAFGPRRLLLWVEVEDDRVRHLHGRAEFGRSGVVGAARRKGSISLCREGFVAGGRTGDAS